MIYFFMFSVTLVLRLGNGKVSSNLINRSKGFGNVFGKSLVEHGNRLRADQPLKIGQVAGTPSWASRIATTRRVCYLMIYLDKPHVSQKEPSYELIIDNNDNYCVQYVSEWRLLPSWARLSLRW
jgi:hypothetical protein